MSRNTCGARRRINAAAIWLAGVLAAHAAGAYRLAADLPARLRKGEPASLILRVDAGGRPAHDVAACLVPAPLFASEEDAADTTPAIGIDLGVGADPSPETPCVMAIAGVRTAPGVYRFTWEPDSAGRVELRFRVKEGRLEVPVDVESAPPSPTVLIAFVLLIGTIMGAAAGMRRRQTRQGGAA